MYQRINSYEFADEMMKHGFTYEGAHALFEYLEDLEDSFGEEIEFDPIELHGEFHEYGSIEDAMEDILAFPDDCTEEEFEDDYVVWVMDSGGVIIHNI